jgi:hypothetical protein
MFFVMTPNFPAIPRTSGPNLHNSLFSLSVIYRYLYFSHRILFLHPRMWDMAPFCCLRACGRLGCCIPLCTPRPHQLLLSLVVIYSPLILLCRCRMRIHHSASGTWMPRALNVPTFSSLRVILLTPLRLHNFIHTFLCLSPLDKNDLLHHFFPLSLPHPQLSACSINLLTPWSPLLLRAPLSRTHRHLFSFCRIHSIILHVVIIPILGIRWMLWPVTNSHCSLTGSPLPPTLHMADPSASDCLLRIHQFLSSCLYL